MSLVKSAITKDSEGRYAAAINLYCESMEYFIPIVKSLYNIIRVIVLQPYPLDEYDANKREELRRKVTINTVLTCMYHLD